VRLDQVGVGGDHVTGFEQQEIAATTSADGRRCASPSRTTRARGAVIARKASTAFWAEYSW